MRNQAGSYGPRRRRADVAKADARSARLALVMADLVSSGDAVVIGVDAEGLEQYGLAPAGLARMRAELEADGVNPADPAAVQAWIAGLFV